MWGYCEMNHTCRDVHIFIGGLERGGTQRNCVNIANMLFLNGHSVEITTVRNVDNDGYKDDLCHGVLLRTLNRESTIHSIIPLINVIRKINKDTTILIMNYELLPFIVLVSKCLRKKSRIVVRNMNYISKSMASKNRGIFTIIQKYLMLLTFPLTDVVVHQCNAMKKDFHSYCLFQPKHSTVIKNVVNFPRKSLPATIAQKPYLLLVGRLVEQKNIRLAIDILKSLHNKSYELNLIVIGEGDLLSDLQDYAERLGLLQYIKFLGRKNNVNEYYFSAHATILTSNYEGFPNVLIESMSCGTPVVAHNCKSGPEELIVNGENGFLVGFQNILEFVDAIIKIKNIDRSSISSTITAFLPANVYNDYSKIL